MIVGPVCDLTIVDCKYIRMHPLTLLFLPSSSPHLSCPPFIPIHPISPPLFPPSPSFITPLLFLLHSPSPFTPTSSHLLPPFFPSLSFYPSTNHLASLYPITTILIYPTSYIFSSIANLPLPLFHFSNSLPPFPSPMLLFFLVITSLPPLSLSTIHLFTSFISLQSLRHNSLVKTPYVLTLLCYVPWFQLTLLPTTTLPSNSEEPKSSAA